MANPVLESFEESPKACVTNSSRPPEKLKGKENLDLPSVCSNYWPTNVALSLCFAKKVFHHKVTGFLAFEAFPKLPAPYYVIVIDKKIIKYFLKLDY